MPLASGSDQATISRNISELTHHGSIPRSHRQIVAIALSNADRHPHKAFGGGMGMGHIGHVTAAPKMGGSHAVMSPSMATPWWTRASEREMTSQPSGMGMPHMQAGGMMPMGEASPWWERQDSRQINDIPHGGGLIGGSGAGRTDRLPLDVAADSHVIPADVLSGIGQGHSLAGAKFLQAAMATGPYGTPFPHEVHGHGPPRAPGVSQHMLGEASGGNTRRTSILAASGEMIIEPHDVEALGHRGHECGLAKKGEPPMETGHRLIDEMIHHVRQFTIQWLKHAPPPKK